MAEQVRQQCKGCKKVKRIEEFGWSPKKRRPTKTCRACWTDPMSARTARANESTEELLLYYTHIRGLMVEIEKAHKDTIEQGLPVDRKLESLGDVWISEMTEEAYRAIVQALIAKAGNGDVNAAKLLLEERHRRLGEPTKASVDESWDDLLKIPPLTPGLDTE